MKVLENPVEYLSVQMRNHGIALDFDIKEGESSFIIIIKKVDPKSAGTHRFFGGGYDSQFNGMAKTVGKEIIIRSERSFK